MVEASIVFDSYATLLMVIIPLCGSMFPFESLMHSRWLSLLKMYAPATGFPSCSSTILICAHTGIQQMQSSMAIVEMILFKCILRFISIRFDIL